jgi:pimeloyl-ACP methyl ester carboxylesterase
MSSSEFPKFYEEPPEFPPPKPPASPVGLLGEWRVLWQIARSLRNQKRLRSVPQGKGEVVLLIPGWKAPESSMWPLGWYLRGRGYKAAGWGFGTNQGDPEGDSQRMASRVEEIVGQTGAPVSLVGWSLGGVVARETARLRPELVSQVISYGTPAFGGPTYTLGASAWGEEECEFISRTVQ